jgi:hypothetical protein
MQVLRNEDGSFQISGVEAPLQEVLCAIPEAADYDSHPAAQQRLFPAPGPDAEAIEEWQEFVEPELRHLFEDAMATVARDLQALETDGSLLIPANHLDAWLNALNQARLTLAAKHALNEEDMERPIGQLLESERDYALFQIHLYGFLQECFLRGMA